MLKWSRQPYDPKGVDSTPKGGCAVLCLACPQHDKNLPADWRKASPTDHWLYGLFVAIDTNFWLKQKVISKDSVDPSLSCGWGYFVKEHVYKAFLDNKSNISQEVSFYHGLAATVLGTIDCACHNMKLLTTPDNIDMPPSRYVNMDYLFFSTLCHTTVDILNISYDIACQWNKHLWHHMASFPPLNATHTAKKVTFFMPKFYLPAHIESCQTSFSFNFACGIGRMDGDAPERGWVNINPMALSTKEMGPGTR
ncbi:hypothetical protein BDR05DRAFT_972471 [Suillus weaverae]|nr:hypothetical protein BDR05DRAFT_972471 [Suillus weaverae]